MIMKLVVLCTLAVAVYTLPAASKSKSNLKSSLQKRSIDIPQKAAKRSSYDTFTKFDQNKNEVLDPLEMAWFFYRNFGFPLEEAAIYGKEQIENADLNGDGLLDRWEWGRTDDYEKYGLYY